VALGFACSRSSRTPNVTARILDHLGLASAVPPIAPARAPPDDHVRELELAFDDF